MKPTPTPVPVCKEDTSASASTLLASLSEPWQSTIRMPCLWYRWLVLALITILGYAYGQYDNLKIQQAVTKSELKAHESTLAQVTELSKQVNGQAGDITGIKKDTANLQRDIQSLMGELKDQRGDIKELLMRTPMPGH